jgi:hypothetical protein
MGFFQVLVSFFGGGAAPGGAIDHANHQQIGLINVFEIRDFFADGRGDGFEADGPAMETFDDGRQVFDIDIIEAELIDFEGIEGGFGFLGVNDGFALYSAKSRTRL